MIRVPIAHHDGNYFATESELKNLEERGRVVFRYCNASGELTEAANVNGSMHSIAGIINEDGNVLAVNCECFYTADKGPKACMAPVPPA